MIRIQQLYIYPKCDRELILFCPSRVFFLQILRRASYRRVELDILSTTCIPSASVPILHSPTHYVTMRNLGFELGGGSADSRKTVGPRISFYWSFLSQRPQIAGELVAIQSTGPDSFPRSKRGIETRCAPGI